MTTQYQRAWVAFFFMLISCSSFQGGQDSTKYAVVRVRQESNSWMGGGSLSQLLEDKAFSVVSIDITSPIAVDSLHRWLIDRYQCSDTSATKGRVHAVIIVSSSYGRDTLVVSRSLKIHRLGDNKRVCGQFDEFILYAANQAWTASLSEGE